MPHAPDVTVVVLSWNTKALTLQALRSIPAAADPFEVQTILVDNASRDGTPAAAHAALPAVQVLVSRKNVGYARGNDIALKFAKGRYLCFLNSDATPHPGAIAHVVRYLDTNAHVGIASPPLVYPDGKPQRTVWGFLTPLAMIHDHTPLGWVGIGKEESDRERGSRTPAEKTGRVQAVSGACLVIRRDLCERLQGFDRGYRFYCEDVDLCWRAQQAGFEVHVVADGPAVVHVGGASAMRMGGALRLPFLAGIIRFVRRSQPLWVYGTFAPIFKIGVVMRSAWEVIRSPFLWVVRRSRPERAARTIATARARLRFLERDLGRFMRSWPGPSVSGRPSEARLRPR